MNTKTRRLKEQAALRARCTCIANHQTRTIYLCDYCASLLGLEEKALHIPEEERIG
jgi:hypothetical protein